MTDSSKKISNKTAHRMLLTSGAFYLLIAFEFFYMASPFAAYFYAVYGPGLDTLQEWGLSGWMLWFFLPHIVAQTKSTLIDLSPMLGAHLFVCGLLAFSLGALQVYRAKIGKRGAVTRGLYRYVRHPQYTALVVASLGMLLIWPRFLVLYSTIVMIFTYVALARAEERICTEKYDNYDQYLSQTGGFVPKFFGNTRGPKLLEKIPRPISAVATMFFVLATATVLALSLRQHAIASLYTLKDTHGIYLSVTRISETKLSRISDLARTNAKIETTLSSLNKNDSFIAYVLPTEMYISEIPMTLPKGQVFGHSVPKSRDINRYKVIYTRAEFTNQAVSETENILYHSVNKHPLIEVHVNLNTEAVESVLPVPKQTYYGEVQVPVF